MSLDLVDPESGARKPAFPGNKGFLVVAKLRGMRNVTRESSKRLKAFIPEYCKARGLPMPVKPAEPEQKTNGQEESAEANEDETLQDTDTSPSPKTPFHLKIGPNEFMYDNCSFVASTVEDPSDYAHFIFCKMADDRGWPQPRFPLRIMPVQEICCLTPKAIEAAVTPIVEKVFAGEEALRFSIIFHGKHLQDSKDMSRHQVEAVIRNIIWSVNPNCVQCIKYQDYAVLLEIIDPLLFVGIAKEFNQLGRYNTATIQNGRDLKETMEDSEDEISDDPELSEAANIKKKLRIKKKRRLEKEKEEELLKAGKLEEADKNGDNDVMKDEVEEDIADD